VFDGVCHQLNRINYMITSHKCYQIKINNFLTFSFLMKGRIFISYFLHFLRVYKIIPLVALSIIN